MLKNRFNPLHAQAVTEPPHHSGGSSTPAPEAKPEGGGEDEEEEEEEDEEEQSDDEAPAAAQRPPGLSAFERGKLRALGSGKLIARLEKAEGDLFQANATIGQLQAEITGLKAEAAEVPKKLAAAEKIRDGQVAKEVTKELTGLGISEAAAPSQIPADQTPEAMLEKFGTLNGAEKTAFFREHKAVLKAAENSRLAASKP